MGWLFVATLIKAASLTLHEVRLWISMMPDHRRPAWPIIGIGYTSGLVNAILPARGGDIVAVALLKKEHDVPVPAALAAVGVTAMLEALVFALFLMVVLILGGAHWDKMQIDGGWAIQPHQAMIGLGICCGVAMAIGIFAIHLSRKKQTDSSEKKGISRLVRKTLEETGVSLGSWRHVALNLLLALVQVFLVVGCFAALIPTVGLELDPDLPILAVSGVIAFGALSAVLLPPSLGAGPAVSAVLVFSAFGVEKDQALAFAAMSWFANTIPVLTLGLWPLLSKLRHFGSLKSLVADVDTQEQAEATSSSVAAEDSD